MYTIPFVRTAKSGQNWTARIDPRLKLLAVLLILVALSVTLSSRHFLFISVILTGVIVSLGVERSLLRGLLMPAFLVVLITFLMHVIFAHKHGPALFNLLGLRVTEVALAQGALFCWRIVLFFMVAVCFLHMLTAEQVAAAVWRTLSPLRRVRFPADDVGLMLYLGIRFIPEIFNQYKQIKLAQTARGATFTGNLLDRTRAIIPLLVPVTVMALRKSDSLSACLVVRGWGSGRERSYYGWQKLKLRDYLFALHLLVFILIILSI